MPPASPSPDPADAAAWLARAREGDEAAFGQLMLAHHALVYRRVLGIVGAAADADEVCQDVWLTVWRELPRFRGEARFTTWLFPIATRRALDQLRKRRRWFTRFLPFLANEEGETVFEPIDPADTRDATLQAERRQLLDRALAALPPLHRTALALREIEGLSYDEIAAELGIPRGTVMSRLFHARRLLARQLQELPCD
jgi:RNA polymerase sigma-70 factor, ECF subfamily